MNLNMESFLRMEIKILFVIQGFLSSLRCRREHDFSGACLINCLRHDFYKISKNTIKVYIG